MAKLFMILNTVKYQNDNYKMIKKHIYDYKEQMYKNIRIYTSFVSEAIKDGIMMNVRRNIRHRE